MSNPMLPFKNNSVKFALISQPQIFYARTLEFVGKSQAKENHQVLLCISCDMCF